MSLITKGVAASSGFAATGGTITTDGARKVHTFTTSGTFTVTHGHINVTYLVVAAGGGSDVVNAGQGGQVQTSTMAVGPGAYTVTVAGTPAGGASGGNSQFVGPSTITATGGTASAGAGGTGTASSISGASVTYGADGGAGGNGGANTGDGGGRSGNTGGSGIVILRY